MGWVGAHRQGTRRPCRGSTIGPRNAAILPGPAQWCQEAPARTGRPDAIVALDVARPPTYCPSPAADGHASVAVTGLEPSDSAARASRPLPSRPRVTPPPGPAVLSQPLHGQACVALIGLDPSVSGKRASTGLHS